MQLAIIPTDRRYLSMFGKPEWFKEKSFGWGLFPVSWQGWTYTGVWSAILCGPFLFFVVRSQILEAVVWISAAMVGLTWDVFDIIRQKRKRSEVANLFYIGEEGGDEASTEKFDLKVKG